MRHLILMRHAKTERSNPGGDHARQLVPRGVEDCALIIRYLHDNDIAPAHALVSSATRTRETMAAMQPALARGAEIEYLEALYLAEAMQILQEIRSAADQYKSLLVIGHNPGMHELAFLLTSQHSGRLRADLAGNFPTAATAVLSFSTDRWADVSAGEGMLQHFATAKFLRPLQADTAPDKDDAG